MSYRRVQIIAFACGALLHIAVWVHELRKYNPGSWLCGELSCWALIAADLPLAALYSASNSSVTWGSLVLGTIWWGMILAGAVNVGAALLVIASSKVRSRFIEAYRQASLRIALSLWTVCSVVVLASSCRYLVDVVQIA